MPFSCQKGNQLSYNTHTHIICGQNGYIEISLFKTFKYLDTGEIVRCILISVQTIGFKIGSPVYTEKVSCVEVCQ